MGLQTSIILALFSNFYYKTYIIKKRSSVEYLNNNVPNEKSKVSWLEQSLTIFYVKKPSNIHGTKTIRHKTFQFGLKKYIY